MIIKKCTREVLFPAPSYSFFKKIGM